MLSVRDKGALRLDERRWRCEGCGAKHDRDVNAANNIEAEGLRILMHPEETGSVCASGGEGEGPDRTRARGRVSANQPSGVNGVRNTANDATAEFRKQTSGETPIPRSESLSAAAATAYAGLCSPNSRGFTQPPTGDGPSTSPGRTSCEEFLEYCGSQWEITIISRTIVL